MSRPWAPAIPDILRQPMSVVGRWPMRHGRRALIVVALISAGLFWPRPALAQEADEREAAFRRSLTDPKLFAASPQQQPQQTTDPRRACDGCPIRRVGRPFLEAFAINVMYNGINHARHHPTAHLDPGVWLENLKSGFEWDTNRWVTNQFGHPYQGSNYYTAARANGLSFWEASSLAAFGSGTWEYFFENNRASLNDLINTTLGGIALGEVMYRSAWLLRHPEKTKGRGELIATAIDPMGGLERAMSGDWSRVTEKPRSVIPASLNWRVEGGLQVQGESLLQSAATGRPFVDGYLFYGDVRHGYSKMPFEAFTLEIAAGDSLAHAQIHGRLFGSPFGSSGRNQVTLFQTYDFIRNPAYDFGGQGFEVEVSTTRQMFPHWSAWLAASGGATVLAAANSLLVPADGSIIAPRSEERTYDYGPGARFGGVMEFRHQGFAVFTLDYQAYQVNVVDGTRATHVLQRLKADFRVPVSSNLALGAMVEYFYREAYFWGNGTRTDESPAMRIFLAWSKK